MDNPVLVAEFDLDKYGRPVFHTSEGLKHYSITLRISGAPADTYAVTYELHPTYYEPTRESRARGDEFAESITSYGNYTVQAKVRSAKHVKTIAADLHQALRRSYKLSSTPDVDEALRYIADN